MTIAQGSGVKIISSDQGKVPIIVTDSISSIAWMIVGTLFQNIAILFFIVFIFP